MTNNTKNAPAWCLGEAVRRVYQGRIRNGKFGSLSPDSHEVWEIERLRLGFLNPLLHVEYTDDSYRVAVNDSASINQYFNLHANQQRGYLDLFQSELGLGMTVADCGCGGGLLLDLVKAKTVGLTLAVEPFQGYHQSLRERGHEVFTSTDEAQKGGWGGEVDLALSFHVIEHVNDPVAFLQGVRALVRPGGLAFVLTPNWDDILVRLDPARMHSFFYRQVHNYYFTSQALRGVSEMAGWTVVGEKFYHEFGLANALLWLRDGCPAGHAVLPEIGPEIDEHWKRYLTATGQTNNVGIVLRNEK